MNDKPYKYTRTCPMYEMKAGEYAVICDGAAADRGVLVRRAHRISNHIFAIAHPEAIYWIAPYDNKGGYLVDVLSPDEMFLIVGGEVFYSAQIKTCLNNI